MTRHSGEIARFIVVGAVAVAVDFVVYFALLELTNLHTSPSKAISYICGNVVSFTGNRYFVFRALGRAARYQIIPFSLLYATTLVLNNVINEAVLVLSGIRILAWLAATTASTVTNFLGLKFVVFRHSL